MDKEYERKKWFVYKSVVYNYLYKFCIVILVFFNEYEKIVELLIVFIVLLELFMVI